MNDANSPALSVSRNVDFNLNWVEFSSGLVETFGSFLLKGWADTGVSGIVALSKLITSVSAEESPEARAWRLVALCFAWALDDIKASESLNVDKLRSALREALDRAKAEVDRGEHVITKVFLQAPSSLSLYKMMRDVVIERRIEIGVRNLSDDVAFSAKLDSSFTLGVFEVWSQNFAYYNAISDYLQSPPSVAAERELNWRTYRHSLVHSFEVGATFGQEATGIALAQIYVPLRAYWEEEETDGRRGHNEDGRIPKNARGLFLDITLDEWCHDGNSHDWLRLIGGGPGSGKSTTLRALARRLADNRAVRPLFIPLQHIGIAGDLRSAINRYFTTRSGSAFTHEPLGRISVETGSPLILIFDGLDELVAPNENAKETISLFVHKMNTMINELRGDNASNLKVVVSGRMLAFQSARRLMTLPVNGSLEVYGYLPASLRGLDHPDPIWDIDQRKDWWKGYSKALGIDPTLPQAFIADELSSITHEPLLSYLLVLAGFSSHNWERAAENPNRIYATLMSDIYARGWGGAATVARSMTSPEFNLLMQTIGLAAWLGGDSRVASETAFLSTVAITKADDAWFNFNSDNGPDVTNLAMNFYLKASDKNGRGFEFTHKSFGEYLAALAIIDVATEMHNLTTYRLDYALQEWVRATSTGQMTHEVMSFIRQEVRLRIQEGSMDIKAAREIKASFERIVDASASLGFPYSHTDNWRVSEKRQQNSEAAAWIVLNAIVRALISKDDQEDATLNVRCIEGLGITNLLYRQNGQSAFFPIISSCLTGMKADDFYLFNFYGFGLDLSHTRIKRLIIEGGRVFNGSLQNCDVETLSIHSSQITDFSFKNAKVGRLNISNSILKDDSISNIVSDSIKTDEETILFSSSLLHESFWSRASFYKRNDGDDDIVANTISAIEKVNELYKVKIPDENEGI